MRSVLFIALAVILLPRAGLATDRFELIVSRNAEVTSVYMRAPAKLAEQVFGRAVLPPTTPDDVTFGDAQRLVTGAMPEILTGVTLRAAGQVLELDPLPGILHRSADPLRFQTPLDGSLSTAVCATPSDPLPPMEALDFLGGFRADVPLRARALQVAFPLSQSEFEVDLRVFERGDLVRSETRRVTTDRPLIIGPTRPPFIALLSTVAFSIALFLFSWWLFFGRGRPRLSRV